MSVRTVLRRIVKRIGGAFGASDVLNELNITRDIIVDGNRRADSYAQDALPYLKYYYFNEFAKNLHPLLFEKYRDCNKGKKVVIVACGPSLDKYKPIKRAKHLAINRAFLRDDIKFDYIFMHDSIMIDQYKKNLKKYKADKFIAFATKDENAKLFNAASEDVKSIGAKRFILSNPAIPDTAGGQFDVIQPDIAHGAILDRGGGTVFSALQFVLFTHPKEVYLVGCDCTKSGYFNKVKRKEKQNLLEKTEYLWHEVKAFTDQYYPDIKIISVNPVKLKGLFTDLKQK